jgi:hypothetical protein
MKYKRVFIIDPERCHFYKGEWIERGHTTLVNEQSLEDRMLDLEIQFGELNKLLVDVWAHFQPLPTPEDQEMVNKIMKLCQDMHDELYKDAIT